MHAFFTQRKLACFFQPNLKNERYLLLKMNTAIFEFYEHGEFRLGVFTKDWGQPANGGYLHEVFDNLYYGKFNTTEMLLAMKKMSLYIQISQLPSHKNPFPNQFEKTGEPIYPFDVYWFSKLSEKRLIRNNVYSPTNYEFHIGKKQFKFVVRYNETTKEFKQSYSTLNYQTLLKEITDWAFQLDRELADCDCIK